MPICCIRTLQLRWWECWRMLGRITLCTFLIYSLSKWLGDFRGRHTKVYGYGCNLWNRQVNEFGPEWLYRWNSRQFDIRIWLTPQLLRQCRYGRNVNQKGTISKTTCRFVIQSSNLRPASRKCGLCDLTRTRGKLFLLYLDNNGTFYNERHECCQGCFPASTWCKALPYKWMSMVLLKIEEQGDVLFVSSYRNRNLNFLI